VAPLRQSIPHALPVLITRHAPLSPVVRQSFVVPQARAHIPTPEQNQIVEPVQHGTPPCGHGRYALAVTLHCASHAGELLFSVLLIQAAFFGSHSSPGSIVPFPQGFGTHLPFPSHSESLFCPHEVVLGLFRTPQLPLSQVASAHDPAPGQFEGLRQLTQFPVPSHIMPVEHDAAGGLNPCTHVLP
jgi:hypothetical protein